MTDDLNPQILAALNGTFDAGAVVDLVSAIRDLAASVIEPSLSPAERVSRAERASQAACMATDWVPTLDPYTTGQHSRLRDLAAATAPGRSPDPDALDRLGLAFVADQLRHETRAPLDAESPATSAFPILDTIASPAQPLRLTDFPAEWEDGPDATIGTATAPDDADDPAPLPMTTARWGLPITRQLLDWPLHAAELEAHAAHVVNSGLERNLAAGLASAAPIAASLEAAESAIGAVCAAGADLVLCGGADLPVVRRAYAHAHPADRPTIMGTAGLSSRRALVVARSGIVVESSVLLWTVTEAPRSPWLNVVSYRYGRVRVRRHGSVQLVEVA